MHSSLKYSWPVGAIALPLLTLSTLLNSPSASAQGCVDCAANEAIEAPASEERTVEISDWQVSFDIPENYQMVRSGSVIDVLAPSSYEQTQCRFIPHPAQSIRPYGISVALVDKTLTESDIRAQIDPGEGTYLGPTGMPSGIALMHTTHDEHDLIHVSLPVPGEAATVVFTANTDSTGEIFQEEVLETILGSFEFEDEQPAELDN
ncbi:MAG: hypothetical protein WBG63_05950 [Phormidesmis sp.]